MFERKNMNLDYVRYFVKLAEVKHYTRAAEELCISQPSLSHAMRQLEGELGVELFEKRGHNTALTESGEEFLTYCRRTLDTLDEGVAQMARNARGEGLVRLGFLRVAGVDFIPELARKFKDEHEGCNVDFEFHVNRTGELLKGLMERKHDIIFCSEPAGWNNIKAVPVAARNLVLVVPTEHELAAREKIRIEEIADYPQIYFAKGSGLREAVDEMYEAAGRTPNIAYETEEDQVMAGLAARNFGVAIVPYIDVLRRLDVKVIEIDAARSRRDIYMVTEEGRTLKPAAQNFYDFVLKQCAGREIII